MRSMRVVLIVLVIACSAGAPVRADIITIGDVDPDFPGTDPWVIAAELRVGNAGEGEIAISNGSSVSNTFGRIGRLAGSIGTATVSGGGSTWTNSQALNVGDAGDGTLLIEAGGKVSASSIRIANDSGASGDATVTGANSMWTTPGGLVVGFGPESSAQLTISDGGGVSNSDGTIGFDSDSICAATVTGAGSTWTNNSSLVVGSLGSGTLTVEAGGSVENTTGTLGFNEGSSGTAVVSGGGATWDNSAELVVGNFGTGELTIGAGGNVENTAGTLGADADSMGTVTVVGGVWNNDGQLIVGEGGKGTLTIEAGGSVFSESGVDPPGGLIGDQSGSSGDVTVTGAGSTWTIDDYLIVGIEGEGTLTIADGGLVEQEIGSILTPSGFIGGVSGSTGEVTVTGSGSRWTIVEDLRVGDAGVGTLTIADGGRVENTRGRIAVQAGSTGTVTVGGAGSVWDNSDDLRISNNGMNGSGTLTIDPGGAVNVGDETILRSNGLLRLHGGTLSTATFSFDGGGTFEWTGGTLHVGTFNGDLVNGGGALAPGNSAGITTIVGDYAQQTGATLEIEIGGTAVGSHLDFVSITGNAQLDGQLVLALISGFIPDAADTFAVLSASGGIDDAFANVENGQRLDTVDGGGSFLVHYGPGSTFNENQVLLSEFVAACPADIDGNGTVDVVDLLAVLGDWGACEAPCPPACAADTNGDCIVNVLDLLAVLGAWGSCF